MEYEGKYLVNATDSPIIDTKAAEQTTRVVITLQGEAAARLLMYAESMHLHKNVAAKELLIHGMVEKGLLLKKFLNG